MYSNIKEQDLVEVIMDSGVKLVGKVAKNDDNVLELAEPCATMAAPMPNQQTGVMSYVTTMMPFRAVGDDNKAVVSKDKIMSISLVTLPNYVSMWENNIKEYALMWKENGTRDLTKDQAVPQDESINKD